MSEQDVQATDTAPVESAAPDTAPVEGDTAPAQSDTAPDNAPEPELPSWFMKDRYKSIEEQAKAQYEMQSLIGKMGRNWGPPKDDYKMDSIEGMDPNDPILTQLKPALKNMGVSQEGFVNLVKSYQNAQIEAAKSMEAELTQSLTQEDAVAIQDVNRRLDEEFPPEVAADMKAWCLTKKDFHHLRELLSHTPRKTNVPSSFANATPLETVAQVEADKVKYLKEVKAGKVEDKNYWDQLNARFRDAYTRETQQKR